eukprot:11181899-Lingulodinium_polyedra.AAC.1
MNWSPRSVAAGTRTAPGQSLRTSASEMASGMLPSSLVRSANSVRVNGWAYMSSCCASSAALAGGL